MQRPILNLVVSDERRDAQRLSGASVFSEIHAVVDDALPFISADDPARPSLEQIRRLTAPLAHPRRQLG